MNVRIDYCSYGSCALDFFSERPQKLNYQYYRNRDELATTLRKTGNDDYRIWLPRLERFEKWMKNYPDTIDLGYLVFSKNGRIEKIVNIHLYYSVWLKRPLLRASDISEFTVEPENPLHGVESIKSAPLYPATRAIKPLGKL